MKKSKNKPKKTFIHTGQDLYDEFKIRYIETTIEDKEAWKNKERCRRQKELDVMRNIPGRQ